MAALGFPARDREGGAVEEEPLLAGGGAAARGQQRISAENARAGRLAVALGAIVSTALGVLGVLAWRREPLLALPLPASEPMCSTPSEHRGPGPPLTILSITDSSLPSAYLGCLRASRLEYAARFGLEYCEYSGSYAPEEYNFCWKKLVAIKGLLVGPSARPLVWYLDADALIVNTTVDVRDVIGTHGAKDVLFAADYSRCEPHHSPSKRTHPRLDCADAAARPVSGGVIVFRNTRWVHTLLDTVYTRAGKRRGGWGSKGVADNDEFTEWAKRHKPEFRRHASVIPQNEMNSMRKTYARGDFVYHRAGGDWYNGKARRGDVHRDKYAFLTPVCRAMLNNASAVEREGTTAMLEKSARAIRAELGWV